MKVPDHVYAVRVYNESRRARQVAIAKGAMVLLVLLCPPHQSTTWRATQMPIGEGVLRISVTPHRPRRIVYHHGELVIQIA